MTDNTPTREHAEGMLKGILAQRRMEGLADPGPYAHLDLSNPADRRVIQSLYVEMARR